MELENQQVLYVKLVLIRRDAPPPGRPPRPPPAYQQRAEVATDRTEEYLARLLQEEPDQMQAKGDGGRLKQRRRTD